MKTKMKTKFFAIILIVALVLSQTGFAFADTETTEEPQVENATEEIVEETVTEEPAEPEEPEAVEEQVTEEPAAPSEEPAASEVAEEPAAPVIEETPKAEEPKTEEAVSEPVQEEAQPVVQETPAAPSEAKTAPQEKADSSAKKSNAKASSKTSAKNPQPKTTMADIDFDNSTTLCDGTYLPDEITFTWKGGTGRARLDIDKVVVKNGKALGYFTASSANATHVYLAHTSSTDEDPSIYDPKTGNKAEGVYDIDQDKKVVIPVKINEKTDLAMRTKAMGAPHWINYDYTINIEEPEPFVFDNSTSIADGLYTADSFEYDFEGGSGGASLNLESVAIRGGKAYGYFKASTETLTHIYLAKTESNAEDNALYNPDRDRLGPGVYAIEEQHVTIPVKLNTKTDFAMRTTATSADSRWINYSYTITISEEAAAEFDNSTTLKNGTYTPSKYTWEGGSGYAKLTCTKVVVKNGKATGTFTASSENMTHAYLFEAPGNEENIFLYDPVTDTMGKDVYAIADKTVTLPVKLNETTAISVRTATETETHWVNCTYKITVKEKTEEPAEEPSSGDNDKDKDKDKDKPSTPTSTQKLKDGTYKVLSTTDRVMFYLYPKEQDPAYSILTIKDGKMTATITLNGDGYDYVYMGTPEQAVKAGKSKWIKAKIVNGYYTFTIPVSALDKKLAITPRSHKYANDPDMKDQAWRPNKWIKFYSGNAIKIKDGTTSTAEKAKKKKKSDKKSSDDKGKTSGKQTEFKNDNKKDKESKWQDDSSGSTSAVNASTTLPDGVYTPDSFSWSGGSGRLAYIRCNKITVTNGQAYATIEFGSSSYDQLRANGRVYFKNGGGNSTFVIPVKLNANNTIIGRTTAMSQPHWVRYTIYIGLAESEEDSEKAKEAKKEAAEAKMEISDKAPTIQGLESKDEEEEETYAKYFKIFNYEHGVKLLSIDISKDTELLEEYTENAKKALETSKNEDSLEYDDEGNIIAKSKNEYIEGLYRNNVVNYLLVPEDYEVPAGLDKEYIIIQVPSKKSFVASNEAIALMEELGCLDSISLLGIDEEEIESDKVKDAVEKEDITLAGNLEKPNYAKVIKDKSDLSILPGSLLPEEIKKDAKDKEKLAKEAAAKKEELEKLESRFTALEVPVIIDRSVQEEDEIAKAEWIKVYGALFGMEDEAEKIFEEVLKEADKK